MNKIKLLLLLFVAMQLKASCQIDDGKKDLMLIRNIELPFEVNLFADFESINQYGVADYNQFVELGKGYTDAKGKFHKATGNYATEAIVRIHERYNNGKYEKYQLTDSVKIGFVGQVKLSDDYICILVKIEDIPNEYQKTYYYKLLSFNASGNHLSTIKVFELIDDASTKDWMEETPHPNVTSKFIQDGTIQIKWDEGYNEYYIQYVKLNTEGMFVVDKLEEKEKKD